MVSRVELINFIIGELLPFVVLDFWIQLYIKDVRWSLMGRGVHIIDAA